MEGDHIGQAQFPHAKSLTVPFILAIVSGTEVCHRPDQLLVTQVLLLSLFKDEHDLTFVLFQRVGTSSDGYSLLDDREWPCNNTSY